MKDKALNFQILRTLKTCHLRHRTVAGLMVIDHLHRLMGCIQVVHHLPHPMGKAILPTNQIICVASTPHLRTTWMIMA
jgi:hypothetical protein